MIGKSKIPVMLFCCLFLFTGKALSADSIPKYGPKSAPHAVPLSHDHRYLQSPTHPAVDYWNLASFYDSQFNELSCTVASVAMILNGMLRAGHSLQAKDTNITQGKLIRKVLVENWEARVMPGGFNGKVGLNLLELEAVLKASFHQYGVSNFEIDRIEVTHTDPDVLTAFRRALTANERNRRDFILLHFVQDVVTESPGGPYPHVSPVGAYDQSKHRVLVMDVDREWYEPYWVSDTRLLLAMSKKTEMCGQGGYLWIRMK